MVFLKHKKLDFIQYWQAFLPLDKFKCFYTGFYAAFALNQMSSGYLFNK